MAVSPKALGENRPVEQMLSDLHIERLELSIKTARKVAYFLAVLFIIVIVWACVAPVNVISKGSGQLRPFGKPKLVQSEINGRIEQILVSEGSHVEKDSVLIELGSSIYKSKLDKAENELKKAVIKLEQLQQGRKALDNVVANPSTLPVTTIDIGDTANVVNNVYTTYKKLQESKYDATVGATKDSELASEMTDLNAMKVQYRQELGQKQRELALLEKQLATGVVQKKTTIVGLEKKIVSQKDMLKEVEKVHALSKEQEKDYADVVDLGVSRVQFLKVKEQVAENSRKVKNEKATIIELENKLELAKLELPRFKAETESKISDLRAGIKAIGANIQNVNIKMRKSQREYKTEESAYNAALAKAKAAISKQGSDLEAQQNQINELEDSIKIAKVKLSESSIKAPMSGIVTGFKIRGQGEIVRPGQEIMEILPDKSNLVIEAKIANKDIGFVKKGQKVKIKMDAFPFQDFGTVGGTVEEVEKYPELQEKKNYAYTVWIKPNQNFIEARGKKVTFRSGLTCTVEVVVRRVSVMRALLSPVAKLTDLRMKE